MPYVKVDKNKYRIFINDGFYANKKRRRYTTTVTTDLKGIELKMFLAQQEFNFYNQIITQDPVSERLAQSPFKEYANYWLGYKDIADKTYRDYTHMLEYRVLPFLGEKQLNKISTTDIIDFMASLRDEISVKTGKPLSQKTIKNYFIMIRSMFNDASSTNILSKNPIEGVPVPKLSSTKLKDNFYTEEELSEFITLLLNEKSTKYKLLVLLALDTGARVGELLALRWKDLDLDNNKILIEKSVTFDRNNKVKIKSTKNNEDRKFYFGEYLKIYIEEHRVAQKVRKDFIGDNWYYKENIDNDDEDFIFTQDNGKVMHNDTPNKWLDKFIEKNGLRKITFHGLRHTNVTQMLLGGTDYTTVAQRVGHKQTSTTMNFYAHSVQEAD